MVICARISCNIRSVCSRGLYTSSRNHVALTSDMYPAVRRGSFSSLEADDMCFFRQLLGSSRVVTEDLDGYNTDWLRTVRGSSTVVLRPRSTDEVSSILRHCNARRLAVCPQGGNTGLVAGSTPVFDEIILSMSLMNRIISLDTNSGAVSCEGGCVLGVLDQHLCERGFMVPLDLGAKGSCQIGGNISTNAGGLRLVRYGSLHGSVLGLKAVLASGDVIDCMSAMKKDNTGYDLKQLFIGSEGTLGVVTEAIISCPRRPRSVQLIMLGLDCFDRVLETYKAAQDGLGEIISSVEFMDGESQRRVVHNLNLTHPLPGHRFYMMLETSGSCQDHDATKLTDFLQMAMQRNLVAGGIQAADLSQSQKLWALRERIAEALLQDGYNYKYDISMPMQHFYSIVPLMRERLGEDVVTCCGYGHIGDGNLHLNVTTCEYSASVLDRIEPFLYEWIAERGGSVSAEHGLGLRKRQYIGFSKSAGAVALMKQIKSLMDPYGILNPYKVLP